MAQHLQRQLKFPRESLQVNPPRDDIRKNKIQFSSVEHRVQHKNMKTTSSFKHKLFKKVA